MRLILIVFFACSQTLSAGNLFTVDEAKKNGMWETLKNNIEHSSVIADICVYEAEWIPPSKKFWKGRLIQRAVVTHAYCGVLKVGDRVEYVHYFEEDPGNYRMGKSPVSGKLRTIFLDPDESEKVVEGLLKVNGDGHWGFDRVEDVFAELFKLETKTNLKLKIKCK